MAFSFPRPFPDVPGVEALLFEARSAVAITESPLSFAQEVQAHQGQVWQAEVTFPAVHRARLRHLKAWLLSLNGAENDFLMGPLDAMEPLGTWAGTPVVDGSGQSGAELDIRGLDEGATIFADDYLQLGSVGTARLYKHIGDDIEVGPSGTATLDLWPRLRVPPNDGDPLVVVNPVGRWRLLNNTVGWEVAGVQQRLSFQAIEALP